MEEFGFIITRKIINNITNNYWQECYKSIRQFYSNTILIIDDNSDINFINNYVNTENCIIINNEFHGSGELAAYYYYYHCPLFKQAIILHDSTIVNNKLYIPDVPVSFLWSFVSFSYDDILLIKYLISLCTNNEIITQLYESGNWMGCFGVMSVIKHDFLVTLHQKYNFLELMKYVNSRELRQAMERLFALLCYLENNKNDMFGIIHKHHESFDLTYEERHKYNYLPITKYWTGR